MKMNLGNKATSELRTVFLSPLGVPNSQVPLYLVKEPSWGPMLLSTINRKLYMRRPSVPSHLTVNDLEMSNSKSPTFQRLISRKAAKLGNKRFPIDG